MTSRLAGRTLAPPGVVCKRGACNGSWRVSDGFSSTRGAAHPSQDVASPRVRYEKLTRRDFSQPDCSLVGCSSVVLGDHHSNASVSASTPPSSAPTKPRSQILCHDSKSLCSAGKATPEAAAEPAFPASSLVPSSQSATVSCGNPHGLRPRAAAVSCGNHSPRSPVPASHRQLCEPSASPTTLSTSEPGFWPFARICAFLMLYMKPR